MNLMNKKGAAMLAILFAIVYFMLGMILYQFLKPDITIQRDADHLNCALPDTAGDRFTCLILDAVIPIIILGILSTAGGIITDSVLK